MYFLSILPVVNTTKTNDFQSMYSVVTLTSNYVTKCCYLRGGVTRDLFLGLRAYNERAFVKK